MGHPNAAVYTDPVGYSAESPTRPSPQAPTFYITGRQPLSPAAILLAIVAAFGAMAVVLFALSHTRHGHFSSGGPGDDRAAGVTAGASSAGGQSNDDDDPNQVDTVVLGDPSDAPEPARPGNHVSSVHPTILIHLPRSGERVGMIPNSQAGQLLYKWLAAFNRPSYSGLVEALPTVAPEPMAAAQLELRRQTGGFSLLSAKEVLPGVLVFRLHDQTATATDVLGTLQVRPNSNPATIASFSLRAVSPSPAN
jgi:hypothetical protein